MTEESAPYGSPRIASVIGCGAVGKRLEKFIEPEPNTNCWLWVGSDNGSGYGQIRFGGRLHYAHRVVYELFRGSIPEGLTLDHLCRVPSCVNPRHLEPVPIKDNVLRGTSFPAQNARLTHCQRGHQFAFRSNGSRYCRECAATARRARYPIYWAENRTRILAYLREWKRADRARRRVRRVSQL